MCPEIKILRVVNPEKEQALLFVHQVLSVVPATGGSRIPENQEIK